MKMRMFLKAHGLTQREAAAKLDISRPHLAQIVSGAKRPGLDLALRIERLTDGAVPVSSWARREPSEDAA